MLKRHWLGILHFKPPVAHKHALEALNLKFQKLVQVNGWQIAAVSFRRTHYNRARLRRHKYASLYAL